MKAIIVLGAISDIKFKFTLTLLGVIKSNKFSEQLLLMPCGHTDAVFRASNDNGWEK